MIPTPELQSKMIVWRQKCADGTITKEEMKEALAALRGPRQAAMTATAAAKRTKANKVIPSADDLLSELGLDLGGDDE